MLIGLPIHLVANFLQHVRAKDNEKYWLAVDKVTAIIKGVPFLWPTVYMMQIEEDLYDIKYSPVLRRC